MRWLSWFKRGRASMAARYAAEVLDTGWIPPLAPLPMRIAAPARTRREVADEKALRRVYKNQNC